VRERPGRASDDCGITRVGLGFTGVDLRDSPHRQAGQVADTDALVTSHGERQRANRGRLVDDEQHRAVASQLDNQRPELGLVPGQCPVQQDPSLLIERNRVVLGLADVEADEHLHRDRLVLHQRLASRDGAAAGDPDDVTRELGREVLGMLTSFLQDLVPQMASTSPAAVPVTSRDPSVRPLEDDVSALSGCDRLAGLSCGKAGRRPKVDSDRVYGSERLLAVIT
jgi:hypothetical protein